MTATVIPTLRPGSDEWREQRMGGLGGSEIAAVLGLSPWESRFSLWHAKSGIHVRPDEDNEQMEWGRRLEPLVLAKWAEVHRSERFILTGRTYRNNDRLWQLAAPDALAYRQDEIGNEDPQIVEAKTSRDSIGWGDTGTDEIPVYYRAQVMHYMDCLDAPLAHVAVLIGGSDYREYTIGYDPDEAAFIREQAEAFLADVVQGNRPPIDGSDATYQVVKQLHPDIDDETIAITDDLAGRIQFARAALDHAKTAEAAVRTELADVMGTAHYAEHDGTRIADRRARGDGTPYVQWAKQSLAKTIRGEAA